MTSRRDPLSAFPYGIALDELMALLDATSLDVSWQTDGLVVQHPSFQTRIRVLPPPPRTSQMAARAVVDMRSEMPKVLLPVLEKSASGALLNSMATMGAITVDQRRYFVGSRLTIYEHEDAWDDLQLPLLMFAAVGATESLLGGIRRTLTGTPQVRASPSAWTNADLEKVAARLSQVSVCTTGRLGLSAEFELDAGQHSAVLGHHKTALWMLNADEPHPELGGGLFCLLQMPNSYSDKFRLHEVLAELNRMEMNAADQPPHFGAWCPGKSGNNPAYVSFLPNAMHGISGIATNFSYWAMFRAKWAWNILKQLEANPSRPASPVTTPRPTQAVTPTARTVMRSAPSSTPSPQVVPAQRRSRTDRIWLARNIVGYHCGLGDGKLDEITQQIEDQLALFPKELTARDLEKIVGPIAAGNRSILYSQVESIVEALRRPIPGR